MFTTVQCQKPQTVGASGSHMVTTKLRVPAMRWERLAAAFETFGFDTECPLPDSDGPMDGSSPVLYASKGTGKMAIHGSGVNQILFEMVDPKAWAAASNEAFIQSKSLGPKASGLFTFANERAVWR